MPSLRVSSPSFTHPHSVPNPGIQRTRVASRRSPLIPTLGWLTPQHRGQGRSRHVAQLLRADSSSGARSPFVGILLFVRSAASRFEDLHPAHRGVRGPSHIAGLGHGPSRRFASRFRILVALHRRASSHRLRAAHVREPPSSCNARLQAPAALSGVSEAQHSCEPPRGTGSRVVHRPFPSSAQPATFGRQPNPGVQWTRCARH